MALSLTLMLAGVVAAAPSWWWHRLTTMIAGVSGRWLPVLLAVAGGIGLTWEAARRWRRGGAARRRPVAERVPLFGHIAVLLLLATVVAVAVGTGMWAVFDRPHLAVPGTAGATAWTVQNTFDAIKIVLAVVAGIGGVVALTVAYRKQDHGEAAEHRENTKLFNDRFGRAADQLGSDKAAVRLAGVYALAGLADDWVESRQTCIDVLCAYLRMPYTPPGPVTRPSPTAANPEKPTTTADNPDRGGHEERQVRHTVIRIVAEHLRLHPDHPRSWQRYNFDFTGAVFDGGDLSEITVASSTTMNFSNAVFPTGMVNFARARFTGGTVDFAGAEFSGGTVNFDRAAFAASLVDFGLTTFDSGKVTFFQAVFSGGRVDFEVALFAGGIVDFRGAVFSGGTVDLSASRQWQTETRPVFDTWSDAPPAGLKLPGWYSAVQPDPPAETASTSPP
jgi:hypothetical protein